MDGEQIRLNDGSILVFYHFSKIADNDNDISREYDRYMLSDFPLLKEMYTSYKSILKDCYYESYKSIPVAFPVKMNLKQDPLKVSFLRKLMTKVANGINRLAKKV